MPTQTALLKLEAVLNEVGNDSMQNMTTWAERMEKQEESWEGFRPKILDMLLKRSYLPQDCVSLP